jgi:hypothetical protein
VTPTHLSRLCSCASIASEVNAAPPLPWHAVQPAQKFRPICSAIDKLDKEPWEAVRAGTGLYRMAQHPGPLSVLSCSLAGTLQAAYPAAHCRHAAMHAM